jgi:hypothetical protein
VATATFPETMLVELDCDAPGCEAGKIKHEHLRIDPDYIEFHLKNHAYSRADGSETKYNTTPIGADCNCPRVLGPATFGSCQRCKGTGRKIVTLVIPKPGDKIEVRDREVAEAVFGDEIPDYPGIVVDVQGQEEHGLELKTGIGIRVSWDQTKDRKLRVGDITLWTFDLTEVEIVKRAR